VLSNKCLGNYFILGRIIKQLEKVNNTVLKIRADLHLGRHVRKIRVREKAKLTHIEQNTKVRT